MSDQQPLPDDERRVNADGTDPDFPTADERSDPDDLSPAEEDADEDRIDVEDLP